jgi:hypothetical protein
MPERTYPACCYCKLPAGKDPSGAVFRRGEPCPNPYCEKMTDVVETPISEIIEAGFGQRLPWRVRRTANRQGGNSRRGGRAGTGWKADAKAPGGRTRVATAGPRNDNADAHPDQR